MATNKYDVIVVGARCAGSPTAMLLARKGYKVLVVDRATFPSDTISTHLIHPPGVDALSRWSLLDRVVASGCPPIDTYAFDFGEFTISGTPGTPASPVAYGPRRTVLDKILVDAAAESGAEIREGFTVTEVIQQEGKVVGIRGHTQDGPPTEEYADIVVGADGRQSVVAKAVNPEQYNEKPQLLAAYYSYWSDLPTEGRFEVYTLPNRGFAAWPTNDGLTMVVAGWPYAEFEQNRTDIEGNYLKVVEMSPVFAERLRSAKREERFVGTAVPNYFRKPYGPGWVLVGDAGYNKDFITAFGITDAFLQAELLTNAVDESFAQSRPYDEAMDSYQSKRDERALPLYEMTCDIATLSPPPPEMQQLLAAAHGNQKAMDDFARMNSGVLSPPDFFSEENVSAIFAAANDKPH
ncbi:MAG: NAD(P)/FAD-dependent oxidoreductase [Armatimonadota bacterium]|nr:NAD(P)/FAD-dependent oxidoreductase [Armatimonadota bacterium]